MTIRPHDVRSGVTLLELLVVIAVMGVALSVVALGPSILRSDDSHESAQLIAALQRHALATGRDTTAAMRLDGVMWIVTALRDGRVMKESRASIETTAQSGRDADP
jgi:prepilin-type N-terminal cleavage/methylation domain-containing protein